MKFGNITIGGMSFGSTRIGGAKFGNTLVFDGGGSPTPPTPTPTFVDYIQGDGTAYIDTGIKGNTPVSLKVSLIPVAPASGTGNIIGTRKDSGNTRMFFLGITDAKKAGPSYASGIFTTDIDVSASINNGTAMTVQTSFKSGSQKFYVKQDGESSYTSKSHTTSGGLTTGLNIFLFTFNNQGTPSSSSNISGTKIRWVKIYDDDSFTNLVWDGCACYYNGEYGMWDNISNSFFGNAAGSGAFTGPSI